MENYLNCHRFSEGDCMLAGHCQWEDKCEPRKTTKTSACLNDTNESWSKSCQLSKALTSTSIVTTIAVTCIVILKRVSKTYNMSLIKGHLWSWIPKILSLIKKYKL